VNVYDRSLARLRARHPDVPVTIAYLGSPAVIYRFRGGTAFTHAGPVAEERARAASRDLCRRIAAVSARHGAGFVDTRPAFRREAADRLLHGPRDWQHFNEAGYRLLGRLVADALLEPGIEAPAEQCEDRS
jgi:hypothetical protein